MIEKKLDLSHTCHFTSTSYEGLSRADVCLEYTERSPAAGFSDYHTYVDIDPGMAGNIITFLQEAFGPSVSPVIQDVHINTLLPEEPTDAMLRAMSASAAEDDEGTFSSLSDLLDFSGENKTRTVVRAAYIALRSSIIEAHAKSGNEEQP